MTTNSLKYILKATFFSYRIICYNKVLNYKDVRKIARMFVSINPLSLLLISVLFLDHLSTVYNEKNKVEIDKDHLLKNPECGDLPSSSSSRISNSKEAARHYPWVIFVVRRNKYKKYPEGSCGGTIITQASAITSAHCICGVSKPDKNSKDKDKIECTGNSEEESLTKNQIIPEYNTVTVGAGHMDRTEYQKSTKDQFVISEAFVMYDKNMAEFEEYDTGILKRIKGEKLFYDKPQAKNIGPLCLAAHSADLTGGIIEVVGWGQRYSEKDLNKATDSSVTRNPSTLKHSCATNKYEPKKYRFQPCNAHYMKENNLLSLPGKSPRPALSWW